MDPVLADLEASARGVRFPKPLVPVASTLTGNIVSEVGTFGPQYLARQAREPVNFVGSLQACESTESVNEQTLWAEIGPDSVCLGMVRSSLGVPPARLLATIKSAEDNWKTLSYSLATAYMSKVPISWTDYHRDFVDCLTLLELPTYAFDIKDHWSSYNQSLLVPAAAKVTALP